MPRTLLADLLELMAQSFWEGAVASSALATHVCKGTPVGVPIKF